MIQARGTGPQKRLSSLEPRLVAHHEVVVRRIVIVLDMLQLGPPPHGLMKGSFASTPLTTGWPSLIESVSPGRPRSS